MIAASIHCTSSHIAIFTDALSCDCEAANGIRALASTSLVATLINEDCVDVRAAGRPVPQGGGRTTTTTTTISGIHPHTEQSSNAPPPPPPHQLFTQKHFLHSPQTSVPLLRSCSVHSSSSPLSICAAKAPPVTGLRDEDDDDDDARCVKLIEIFYFFVPPPALNS